MRSAPPPTVGQVWIKIDTPRDQDQIVAIKPTTLPGVELITWGGRSQIHTLVWPDRIKEMDIQHRQFFGLGYTESWPPPGRHLHSGEGAPWHPNPVKVTHRNPTRH